jgi:hypothetical protein
MVSITCSSIVNWYMISMIFSTGPYILPGHFFGKLTDLNVWNVPLEEREVKTFMTEGGFNSSQIITGTVWSWGQGQML